MSNPVGNWRPDEPRGETPDKFEKNKLATALNPFQSDRKKVLTVCSAGLLRSPTTALVLSQEPYNFNTRACGTVPQFALIDFNKVLAFWAEEIVCMEEEHKVVIDAKLEEWGLNRQVTCLHIEDQYDAYSQPLIDLIKARYHKPKVV